MQDILDTYVLNLHSEDGASTICKPSHSTVRTVICEGVEFSAAGDLILQLGVSTALRK